jgi:hypothetical protein
MNLMDTYSESGDWIADTVRRKPEALLLLAAGCALLLRATGSSSSPRNIVAARQNQTGAIPNPPSRAGEGIYRAAESASEYASDLKDRLSDTAGSYARSAVGYAEDAGRNISAQSAHLTRHAQSTFQAVREQPLMVAGLGLAAGAAVAALFPGTEVENRTLGGAREAIQEAASKVGQNLMDAAGEAGEKLKEGATERGLHSEGIKELAREVADTFTSTATGKSQDRVENPGQSSASGQGNPAERRRDQ